MKTATGFLRGFLALWMAMAPVSSTVADEMVEINFDGRNWKMGQPYQRGNQMITEFTLPGESAMKWTELVTFQMFRGQSDPLAEWMRNFKDQLKETTPHLAKWNVIRSSHGDAMFEWSVEGDTDLPDQYEICRLIKSEEGIHLIHYAVKGAELSSSQRTQWIRVLNSAKVHSE